MNNPLHARYYADQCVTRMVPVTQRRQLARDTFLVRFECPEIAASITPGQFVMVRLPDSAEPLLGRAFALYDVIHDPSGTKTAVEIVFYVVGKLTRRLAHISAGETLQVWGPLGNGFQPLPTEHLVMVAGGIGQTPFLALAKESLGVETYGAAGRHVKTTQRVTLCYGARTADLFAGIEDFRSLGVDVRLATDDGSLGHYGLITEVLETVLDSTISGTRVVCCGPEPMMEAVSSLCELRAVGCEVSLETPMACGLGICFSCVARVRDESGDWDYKRTCVEGPVFESQRIVW